MKKMSKARYEKLRAEALTPAAQAAREEFIAGYNQRPEVIQAKAEMLHAETRRKLRLVRAVVARFAAEHPVIAKRYGIAINAPMGPLASALYNCYAEASGKMTIAAGTVQSIGHGTIIGDIDPHRIQGAWIAADWLAKQAVANE
jgi:hypothetical protein